ncbi:unnamed protein product [Bursaphelenchus okinawaensis]|uniref:RGS domain-containing protein n=1 Tax=Bursaphelenchus okinawaensis TaxID=465554 RepID=A0A811KG46_9BILA|nr:unnamed protein product [Bursaphelenchus okinawaensis]CAG9102650.1 unnamed protein product [Bursaphelenchus okinawaensis]
MSTRVHSLFGKLKGKGLFKKKDSKSEPEEVDEDVASSSVFQANSIDAPTVIRSFEELFSELSAMTYFMRYLERNGASNLLKFWIHIEGFQSAGDNQDIEKEARQIWNTYLSPSAFQRINLPTAVVKSIDFETLNKVDCYSKAQSYVWDQLKNVHFKGFMKSPYFIMHQVECFKTGCLELVDILSDHRLLSPFVEFLESQHRQNLIEFILTVESYEEQIVNCSPEEKQEAAMIIYNKYISMQATDPLEFDSAIRTDVESKICTENGIPQGAVFNKAKYASQAVLETHYIPMFMKTDLYRSYVDMLAKSVQRFVQMEDDRSIHNNELRMKRTSLPAEPTFKPIDSNINNNKSNNCKGLLTTQLSTNSTPVKREYNHYKDRSISTSSTVGDDESSSQCSDASVSKRLPSALGRIDILGRYESLFDTSLYHNEETPKSGFRGVLNKYLKQSMAQEDEKSYEMARLIVEDIQNMVINHENERSLPATPRKTKAEA